MFFRVKKARERTYFQIVENRWEDGRSKQRVICTLGRLDELEASGQLDRLISSGAKFSESMMVIDAHRRGDAPVIGVRRIGPGMIFERLWRETGLTEIIEHLLAGRKFKFPVERAVFVTVLNRLFAPGSDRSAASGCKTTGSPRPTSWISITSIVPWPGWVKSYPMHNKRAGHSRLGA